MADEKTWKQKAEEAWNNPDWGEQAKEYRAEQPQPKGGNGHGHDQPPQLSYVDLAAELVSRQWLVSERIPMRNVTLLTGDGAAGKSILLLQLAVATVLGEDWLGITGQPGPVLYLAAEEDADELRRRLEEIARAYDRTREDLADAGLHVLSFAGQDAILAKADRNNIVTPTALFQALSRDAVEIEPMLIVLDNLADVFAGNEIDRGQVRQFVTLLRGFAIEHDAAVILCGHPSLAGMASGTGISGSTAWHNSVKARMYLKNAPADEDGERDKDLRLLEVMKNNYGPAAVTLKLRWRAGVYVLDDGSEPPQFKPGEVAEALAAEDKFLELLRQRNEQGRHVTWKDGKTYAPRIFHQMKRGFSQKTFEGAMERLFAKGKIRQVESGPPSTRRTHIEVVS